MTNRLRDRVAVVTGSGQGIGRAIAIAMAKEGANVVTNNRRPGTPGGDAETTAREITDMGGQAVPFFGDVSEFEVARKLIQTAVDNFGRLDILVNNAGVLVPRMVWDMAEEDWDSVLNTHIKGSFNCTRHACVLMKEQRWGRIVNSASRSWLGTPGMCNYGAAKAGVVGLTRSVARDMGRYGVTCNAFHPMAQTRIVDTEESKEIARQRYEIGQITKEQYERATQLPPAEAVGPFVVYLCTDEAADINGQVFYVAGGHIAIYSEPVRNRSIRKEKEKGFWTVDELIEQVPKILLEGYKNPAPSRAT